MINICAITKNNELILNQSLEDMQNLDIIWFWADFFDRMMKRLHSLNISFTFIH